MKLTPTSELDLKLAELQLGAEQPAHEGAEEIFAATRIDARIAEFQRLAGKSVCMAAGQAALAATMTSLSAELAAGKSGVATPATPSSPRRRNAAVELGVKAQHVLLHMSDRITAESLASRGVKLIKQGHRDCGVCAISKMRAASFRDSGAPRPGTGAEADVCGEVDGSGGSIGGSRIPAGKTSYLCLGSRAWVARNYARRLTAERSEIAHSTWNFVAKGSNTRASRSKSSSRMLRDLLWC